MVGIAQASELKNGCGDRPIVSRKLFITPSRKSRIHRNSRATTTFDISHGVSTRVRIIREPDRRSRTQAMPMANTVWMPMLIATYLSVTQRAFKNTSSLTMSW